MRRGFTLLEMLVVIVIIGILASMVAVGVNSAITSSRNSMTEAMIGTLSGALEQYKTRHGDYPPSTLEEMKVPVPNDVNNGIESLVACLSSRKGGGALITTDLEFANADADKCSRNPTDWFFGDNELREYLDAFGMTMTYLHHKDYERPKATMVKCRFSAGEPDVTIAADRNDSTKTFSSPARFQIRSVGSDGKWGTSDDVRSTR